MNVKITYLLSEQAQRAQMAATGEPVQRKQITTVDLPVTDLDVCVVHEDGTCAIDCGHTANREALRAILPVGEIWGEYYFASRPSPADIPALIRQGTALLAGRKATAVVEEKARQQVKDATHLQAEIDAVQAFLSDPTARGQIDSHHGALLAATGTVSDVTGSVPGNQAIYICLHPEAGMVRAEVEARNSADNAAKAAAELAKEVAKQIAIDEWISALGTPLQQSRHRDVLLHRAEALELMAAWVMHFHGVPSEDPAQVCQDSDCPCCETEITTLSESSYVAWVEVRDKLPNGYTVSFWRVKECAPRDQCGDRDEDACGHHIAAYLSIPYGPFRFERQIHLARGSS